MSSNFFSEKLIKKSRKPHKCECCYSSIPIGQPYISGAGVYDNDFFTVKMHEQCRKIHSSEANKSYWGEGIPFEDTYNFIHEGYHEKEWESYLKLMKEIPEPDETLKKWIVKLENLIEKER